MRYLALAAAWYAAALAATAVNPWLAVGPVAPDWLALVSLSAWRAGGQARAVPLMALIGLSADLLADGPLGAATCAHVLVGYGLAGFWPQARRAAIPGLAIMGCAVVVINLLTVGVSAVQAGAIPEAGAVAAALGVGLYTLAVALPGWLIVTWLQEEQHIVAAQR